MPLFSLLFFILCLGNAGTPLTLNLSEYLSLYGIFERLPILGCLASSVVLSAAYTFFLCSIELCLVVLFLLTFQLIYRILLEESIQSY